MAYSLSSFLSIFPPDVFMGNICCKTPKSLVIMHMQQQQRTPNKASFICSLHFDEMCCVPGLLGIHSLLLLSMFAEQQISHSGL